MKLKRCSRTTGSGCQKSPATIPIFLRERRLNKRQNTSGLVARTAVLPLIKSRDCRPDSCSSIVMSPTSCQKPTLTVCPSSISRRGYLRFAIRTLGAQQRQSVGGRYTDGQSSNGGAQRAQTNVVALPYTVDRRRVASAKIRASSRLDLRTKGRLVAEAAPRHRIHFAENKSRVRIEKLLRPPHCILQRRNPTPIER